MTRELPYLEKPREAIPDLINTPKQLADLADSLAKGTGPVAFDAERAHGHRYHPKAYLFQLRRTGTGTALIDPIAFESAGLTDLSLLVDAAGESEWVVHAASQDLPCMLADRIDPPRLFDTELAARLLNYPAVGLAALVEHHFGLRLRKAHSAANWSKRPLPLSWLTYAALDVEFLIELRELLERELMTVGRMEWAEQEFDHLLTSARLGPDTGQTERWRKMSGVREVRTRRGLAVVRALWWERDAIAARLDQPPGRLLPDSGIITLGCLVNDTGPLPTRQTLKTIREYSFRGAQRFMSNWLQAIASIDNLPSSEWPAKRAPRQGPGNPRRWSRHHPEAAARWERTRRAVDEFAERFGVPPANLIQPSVLRQIVFDPPDEDQIETQLNNLGARPWQVAAIVPVLKQTLTQ